MEKQNLKKLVASLGIASLISAGGLATSTYAASGSGWTGSKKDSTGSTAEEVKKVEQQQVGETSAPVEEIKEDVKGQTEKGAQNAAEETKKEGEKKPGGSGWTGSK